MWVLEITDVPFTVISGLGGEPRVGEPSGSPILSLGPPMILHVVFSLCLTVILWYADHSRVYHHGSEALREGSAKGYVSRCNVGLSEEVRFSGLPLGEEE